MKIPIATIIKPQGIKGEVKMSSSLDMGALLHLKKMFFDGAQNSVTSIRSDGKFLYVFFDGVTDRNQAESLRGKTVYANREDINLPVDTFLVEEILGCKITDSAGNFIGELIDVYSNGVSADVYFVKTEQNKTLSFPFIKKLNAKFDADKNTLTIDEKTLNEVSLYED
jgi:16S rRNA processing protein RimM